MENMIEIKNISKAFKVYQKKIDALKEYVHPLRKTYHQKFWALKNINLTVRRGEVIGIVGGNGSGKSTILKIISGILRPTQGEVVSQGEISSILELSSGFCMELTGSENIDQYLSVIEYPIEKRARLKEKIIEFSDLKSFIDQPIKNYSSGMKSKFAFSIHSMIDPEILILDEVLSVGDERFKQKSYEKMRSLISSGCTVLMVSHNLKSIREICTRAILMDQGELLYDGSPKKATTLYHILNNCPNESAYQSKRTTMIEAQDKSFKEILKLVNGDGENYIRLLQQEYDQDLDDTDVSISDLKFIASNGQEINQLVTGETYRIRCSIHFKKDFDNPCFRVSFKTLKNMWVSTVENDPADLTTSSIKQGDTISLESSFKCLFLNGTYTCNLDLLQWGQDEYDERHIINSKTRVFKVQSDHILWEKIVYLDQDISVQKVPAYKAAG